VLEIVWLAGSTIGVVDEMADSPDCGLIPRISPVGSTNRILPG
jgi:hypothetical protein